MEFRFGSMLSKKSSFSIGIAFERLVRRGIGLLLALTIPDRHRRSYERCGRWRGGRAQDSKRERFEVLHDSRKMELVASTREASKPHTLETMVGLQMREPHLDPLSLVARSGERFCLHLPPCDIAGVLVEIARDLARVSRSAALVGHTSQSRFEAR